MSSFHAGAHFPKPPLEVTPDGSTLSPRLQGDTATHMSQRVSRLLRTTTPQGCSRLSSLVYLGGRFREVTERGGRNFPVPHHFWPRKHPLLSERSSAVLRLAASHPAFCRTWGLKGLKFLQDVGSQVFGSPHLRNRKWPPPLPLHELSAGGFCSRDFHYCLQAD